MNGRDNDNITGKVTFCNARGTSLIDYVLVEDAFLQEKICSFSVGDFNEYSDHTPIYLTLKIQKHGNYDPSVNIPTTTHSNPTRVSWNPSAIDDIKKQVERCAPNIIASLDNIDKSSDGINLAVNNFSNAIMDTFKEHCERVPFTHSSSQPKPKTTGPQDKPWFDDQCRNLYKNYKKCLSFFNSCRSPENHAKLVTAKKKYKTAEIRQKRQYQRHEGNQLELLRRTDPKTFYRVLKGSRKKVNSSITNSEFYEHFKNIAAGQTDEDLNIPQTLDLSIFHELDIPITISEIENAISESKVYNSPGFDNIINEFFKNFSTFFSPLLQKLFNVILNSGCYPTIWSQGIIVPVYKKGDVNNPDNYRGITLLSHMSKLFTSILSWSDHLNSVVTDAQFGFKPGSGTRDAIFVLHSLISKETIILLLCRL